MSIVPTSSGQPRGQVSPGWLFVSLLTLCSLAATIAQDTGLSDRFARAHPALPSLPFLAFFLVPAGYLAFRGGSAAVRGAIRAAQKHPLVAGSIGIVTVGAGLTMVAAAEASPSSPARLPGPASYYDIPGDASILEAHVTLEPGIAVAGGTRQYKIFRLRNTGTVAWVERWLCRTDPEMNTRDNLRTPDCIRIPNTPAGEAVEVRIPVRVANRNGFLTAAFKMSDGRGSWYYRDATPVFIRVQAHQQ